MNYRILREGVGWKGGEVEGWKKKGKRYGWAIDVGPAVGIQEYPQAATLKVLYHF